MTSVNKQSAFIAKMGTVLWQAIMQFQEITVYA